MAKSKALTIVMPAGTASFPALATPDRGPMIRGKQGDPKYRVRVVYDRDDYTPPADLDDKIVEAIRNEWGPKIKPASVLSFMKDGDEENQKRIDNGKEPIDFLAGKIYFQAQCSDKYAPLVIDTSRHRIDPKLVSGGDLVRVLVQLIPCEPSGIKRIGTRLLKVQLVEKRGISRDSADEFGDIDGYVAPAQTAVSSDDKADEDGGNF